MKTINHLGAMILFAATAAACLTGCKSGDRYTQSTGEYIDDANVTRHVKSALESDVYKYPNVSVMTFKGTVQLSGFVSESAQKQRAASLAKGVPGAKDVVNNITVQTAQAMPESIDDTSLTKRVKNALAGDDYKYPEVSVITMNGTVQLSGFVNQEAQKDKAETLAKAVPGVKEVVNKITVKAG
jgi:hyperosmotically inducible protein